MVPARLASTRFPGKALAAETGRPLVLHVVDRARAADRVGRVIVAAPDAEIVDAAIADGVEAMTTAIDHPNGTSRLAEVVERLGPELDPDSIVVNVQGDEPELDPGSIDAVIRALESDPEADMATIAAPWVPEDDPEDPTIVKVVLDRVGRALYFSRSRIPFDRDSADLASAHLRHVGLYAYRARFLPRFAAWPPTPLETRESLEQLRVLEHGGRIAVAVHPATGAGIDTPEQYAAFVARWRAGVASTDPGPGAGQPVD